MWLCGLNFVKIFSMLIFSIFFADMAILNILQTNRVVSSDNSVHNLNQYSQDIQTLVTDYWSELSTTFLIQNNLLSNCIRFRLGHHGPPGVQNYNPQRLGDHPMLMRYLRSVFHYYLRFECMQINFSVSYALIDPDDNNRFLYHSQNYQILPVAFNIHDPASKAKFFDIVSNFDLRLHTAETLKTLTEKYDQVSVTALSVFFSITRNINLVFGTEQRGVINACTPQSKKKFDHNCFFNAISSMYTCVNSSFIKKKQNRANLNMAGKMRRQFVRWVKKKKKIQPSDVFSNEGITSYGIGLAEEFMAMSVYIFEHKTLHKTKIRKNEITVCQKLSTGVVKIREPTKHYSKNINLFANSTNCVENQKHLMVISNSAILSKKQFCLKCGRSFKRRHNLARHGKTNCTKPGRFLPEKTITHPKPIATKLQELFPNHVLKKDHEFVLVKCEILNSKTYQLHIDFMGKSKSIFQTVYQNESLLNCAHFLAELLPQITADTKVSRLKNNIPLLTNLEESLQPSPQTAPMYNSSFESY